VVGAIIVPVVNAFRKKSQEVAVGVMVCDQLITCANCGNPTALGGTYCENCGANLIVSTRVMPGQACPECGKVNSQETKLCRFCGNPLEK
ncbi:MAG TPA: zinc ribbon domain-containing protein, partial [Candidatus Lokiarchaeia archaeon]|nr:zinc ribbon domain-containing protein [Candidatus Lokiarchaeia archaeon]